MQLDYLYGSSSQIYIHSEASIRSELLKESCEVNFEVINYKNGDTVENVAVTFSKKVKRDKNGKIIKQTNKSLSRFQLFREMFFGNLFSQDN